MEIYLERDDKTIQIPLEEEKVVKDLLKEQDIPLESVIIVKNGSICLEDETVTDNDSIKILSVVSGG